MTRIRRIKDYVSTMDKSKDINIEELAVQLDVSKSYLYQVLNKIGFTLPRKKYVEEKKKILLGKNIDESIELTGLTRKQLYNFNSKHKIQSYVSLQPGRKEMHNAIIILLHCRCLSYADICRELGCTSGTVHKLDRLHAIRYDKDGVDKMHKRVMLMLQMGYAYDEISRKTGFSTSWIRQIQIKNKDLLNGGK